MSEIEPSARSVLKHHYPETKLHGDFTTIQQGDYEPIDVLVGGTPCQSFSVAGLRGGLSDDRGNLALEYLRLAERLRPRFVCWENVPGVLSSLSHDAPDPCHPPDDMEEGSEWVGEDEYDADESHAFACFLAGLSALGYGWAYRIYDAQYFHLAQRRERVFVVGCLGDWTRPSEILSLREGLRGYPAPSRTKGERVADSLTVGANQCSGTRSDFTEVANPLGAKRDGGWRGDLDNDTFVMPLLEIGKGSTSSGQGPNGAGVGDDGDVMFTLQAGAQHGVAMALNAHGGSGRMDGESETFVATIAPALSKSNPYGDHESRDGLLVASTLRVPSHGATWRGDGCDNLVAHSLRADGFDASEDGTGRGTPLISVGFQSNAGGQNGEVYYDLSPTIKAQASGGGMPAVAFNYKASAHQSMNPSEISPCIDVGKSDGLCVAFQTSQSGVRERDTHATLDANNGSRRHNGAIVGSAVRRLTPLECCRLQGFRDDYFDGVFYRGKPLADGNKYRLLGNSMAVPVMAWIGQRIDLVSKE